MITESVDRLGPLTVMIANAGIAPVGPTLEVSNDFVKEILNVNFMGVWNCYTHAARQMLAQGPVPRGSITGYKILGAASIAAYKPTPLLSAYSASKAAVRNLTQVFAIEMAPHNISVNCYSPGIVGTTMWEKIDEGMGKVHGRPRGYMLEKFGEGAAMGRVSVPEDVAKVVGGFLCGPDSEFVTGQNIVVDGGIVFP